MALVMLKSLKSETITQPIYITSADEEETVDMWEFCGRRNNKQQFGFVSRCCARILSFWKSHFLWGNFVCVRLGGSVGCVCGSPTGKPQSETEFKKKKKVCQPDRVSRNTGMAAMPKTE